MAPERDKTLVASNEQIKRGAFLCIPWGGQPNVTETVVQVSRVYRDKAVFRIRFLSDGQEYHKEFSLHPAQLRAEDGPVYVVTRRYAQAFLRECIKKQRAAVSCAWTELTRAEQALIKTTIRLEKLRLAKR